MNEIINFLQKLIKCQTTEDRTGEKKKCLRIIEKKFSRDFFIKRYSFKNRPILVLSNAKNKKVDFILAGHIDVVPAKGENFKLKINGSKMYGRGVFDMKASLAASIFAIRDYLRKNNNLKVAIFITSDEEIDGLSTKYLVEKMGYKANFAILPDGGSSTEIVIYQKGFLQIKVTILGKSAHASKPWQANDPIKAAVFLYKKLLTKFPNPKDKDDWKTSLNLTKIIGGEAANQTAREVCLYFDIRYVNNRDKDGIIKEIRNILKDGYRLETLAENGPLIVSGKNFYLRRLEDSVKKVTKKKAKLVRECGTSDAVFFTDNKIPAVLFRPDGGGDHQEKEWVNKASLKCFYDVLLDFLGG